MPLAVTLRSTLDHLDPGRSLDIYVIDGGIRDANRVRLLRSLDPGRAQIHFVSPDERLFRHTKVKRGRMTVATYFRLLAPWLLPQEARRAIYLDSDLLVQVDLGRLWETELEGRPLAAVQDAAAPTVGSPLGLPNHRELGLAPDLHYFNAGVLVMDLELWRSESIPERTLAYASEHRSSLRFWDQDALNAVLAGRFRELDPRWNQLPCVHDPTHPMPFDAAIAACVVSDPYVVHFATAVKPWHWSCRHPLRELFFLTLDRTDWAGWRPRKRLRDTGPGRAGVRVQASLRYRLARLRAVASRALPRLARR